MAYQTHRNWVRKECICICKNLDCHEQRFQSNKVMKLEKLASPQSRKKSVNIPSKQTPPSSTPDEPQTVINDRPSSAFIEFEQVPSHASNSSTSSLHTVQTANTEPVLSPGSFESTFLKDYSADWPEEYFQDFESFTFGMSQSTHPISTAQEAQDFPHSPMDENTEISLSSSHHCDRGPHNQTCRHMSVRSSSLSSGGGTPTALTTKPRSTAAVRSERRRQQNRKSQQAFRQRKQQKLVQLEGEVQALKRRLARLQHQPQDALLDHKSLSIEGRNDPFSSDREGPPAGDGIASTMEPFEDWWRDLTTSFDGSHWA